MRQSRTAIGIVPLINGQGDNLSPSNFREKTRKEAHTDLFQYRNCKLKQNVEVYFTAPLKFIPKLRFSHALLLFADSSRARAYAKFTKTRKIPRNSVEILSNTCLYNIFETYFSYRGYLLAVNLQIYLGTSSLKRANRLCCEKLGTSHDVKGFAIGSFLERIFVERANDDLC